MTRISPEQLQAYLDTALCPVRDPMDPTSNSTEEAVASFRLGRRINAAVDKMNVRAAVSRANGE
jgi:hypothetical protein